MEKIHSLKVEVENISRSRFEFFLYLELFKYKESISLDIVYLDWYIDDELNRGIIELFATNAGKRKLLDIVTQFLKKKYSSPDFEIQEKKSDDDAFVSVFDVLQHSEIPFVSVEKGIF